ncbi:MAG: alpha/beta hydrolase [Chitinophagaceae bacterium]|nr:alpha/beta hydrolase [Chitinophagaceae bacterium]
MKTFIILGMILFAWLILAQSCMQFRISDTEAKKKFSEAGVSLYTETVTVNGFRMHYVKTGDNSFPTLFFVHGSPGSWDAFSEYLKDKDLLAKYRMISIDRPGFGDSEFGNAKDLHAQSQLISPLLTLLNNNKPVYIIGHSLGGPMAIKLAADNPGSFSAIVLLAGSVDPAEEKPEKWRPVLYKTPLNFLIPGAMRPSNEELWYLKRDLVLLKNDFSKITCPVYIIHGEKDNMVPVGNAAYAKQMLVNAKKVETQILPGANHFIPWQHYKEIKEVLMRF